MREIFAWGKSREDFENSRLFIPTRIKFYQIRDLNFRRKISFTQFATLNLYTFVFSCRKIFSLKSVSLHYRHFLKYSLDQMCNNKKAEQTDVIIVKNPTYVYKEQCVLPLTVTKSETYLVPCQIFKMKFFAKIFNWFWANNYFRKKLHLRRPRGSQICRWKCSIDHCLSQQ